MASRDKFPLPKFCFKVTFSKIEGEVPFQEITGLDQEYDFLEYRSGIDPDLTTRKRAGLYKSGQVTFKKGLFSGDESLLNIFKPLRDTKPDHYRADEAQDSTMEITVNLMDESASTPVWTWIIKGAVPIKLSNGDLKSDENAIAIDQLDFVYSRIDSNA